MSTAIQSSPRLRGNCAAIISCTDPEAMLEGPAGTGKSLAILWKLHRAASLKVDKTTGKNLPGPRRILIVRQTRESLTQSALVTFEDHVLSPEWRRRIASNCQRRMRQSYRYPNGSEIVVGGLDKPSKFMSTEYDMIYVNEAREVSEEAYEDLSSRLRNGRWTRYQQMLGDTNPDAQYHWIKKRSESGRLTLLPTRHEDNPRYWTGTKWTSEGERYIARLDRLTGVRYLRLRKGIWAGVEGQVYDEWDEAVHVLDPFEIPSDWPRYRSIDFGFVHPFVVQWWAHDWDGRLYLYRELYGTSRIVSDWAELIKRHSEGERIEWTVCDHDREDRATLEACGIRTIPAHKAVKPGIEAVQERLRRGADGKPNLFILKNALVDRDPILIDRKKPTSTIEEIPGYVWAPPLTNRPAREEPVKMNDDGSDCMRYCVCEVDRVGSCSHGVPK